MRREGVGTGRGGSGGHGRDILLILLSGVTVIALAVAFWAISTRNTPAPPAPQATEAPVTKLKDSIRIPGYDELRFKADTKAQTATVQNPPENFCWLRASLQLADGTLLWTSDLIAPGAESDPVVLNETLAAGVYPDAMLKFECFDMDEALTPLNGAAIKLRLKVGE